MGLKVDGEFARLATSATTLEVEKGDQRMGAVMEMDQFSFKVPIDYRFDRDEANAR